MVSRFGSDATFSGNADGGVVDNQGNPIISANIGPGNAPLGYSILNQISGKFPNGLINFPPPDPAVAIGNFDNPLPFWNVTNDSDGRINAKFVVLDSSVSSALSSAIGSAGVGGQSIGSYVGLGALKIETLNALSGDSFTLSQRAPVAVIPRMKEIGWAVYGYSGTATPTAAFTVQTDVIYYDGEGSAISTATLGSSTNTQIALYGGTVHYGYTQGTSSRDYLADAATSVEMSSTFTITAGTVTEDQAVYISSSVINPQFTRVGGSVVVDVFTSSGTWTRPEGVNYVSIVAVGGGGGGAGGAGTATAATGGGTVGTTGAGGGGASRAYLISNIYVDQPSYAIGIGAGGSGGTATNTTAGTRPSNPIGNAHTAGANGGATSFGSLITVSGGTGANSRLGGSAASVTVTSFYGGSDSAAFDGSTAASGTAAPNAGAAGVGITNTYILGYPTAAGTGVAGGSATTTNGTATLGTAGSGGTGWVGGGGGAGYTHVATAGARILGTSSGGGAAGGGGGASFALSSGTTAAYSGTAGSGGNAAANSGAGGGGGGSYAFGNSSSLGTATSFDFTSGAGGNGAAGFLAVIRVD